MKIVEDIFLRASPPIFETLKYHKLQRFSTRQLTTCSVRDVVIKNLANITNMSQERSTMYPVIHHIEICVKDIDETLKQLRMYGFIPFAKRETKVCKQIATRLSSIVFILTEKINDFTTNNKLSEDISKENFLVLCSRCEKEFSNFDSLSHIDTVFNVALDVKNVNFLTDRIQNYGANFIIRPPTIVEDANGRISFSIVKSVCGNVCHTLLNKQHYSGFFLPGFIEISNISNYDDTYSANTPEIDSINANISHIDHVTMACKTGFSESVLKFYENAFGMKKFKISRDEQADGLILEEGVGLRLRAMEYWRCSETFLVYSPLESHNEERNPRSMMLVVVESLPDQKNCNIETFLESHRSAGIEHIAFSSIKINKAVDKMKRMGVKFRSPPDLYYNELKLNKIDTLINMDEIKRLGILVDREDTAEDDKDESPKILMQIFAEPLFKEKKTFFIEIIQRMGGVGLGTGNVIALLKSIREAERRKAIEENESLSTKEDRTDTRIC